MFGLLGPNGAGKTTTVEILEGYRERTGGRVAVLGMDPGPRPLALRERIGIVLQSSGLYRHLTVREAVSHWAGLYRAPRDVDETIALTGLEAAGGQRTRTLSGGQQRRLDFALALIGDPELVFLDEPTTGFDPAARRQAWDTVRSLQDARQDGAAHDALPRRGAGAGRPRRDHQGRRDPRRGRAGRARRRRRARYRVAWRDADGAAHERETEDPTPLLHELTGEALARGERLHDLSVTQPSLEDVYLELTAEDGSRDERARAATRAPARAPARRLGALAPRRLAPVPARAQDVLAQPERGVLQLPAAAALPRAVRRDLRRATRPTCR